MTSKSSSIGTHQKALEIKLDQSKYGTFAEIGAGQEVARWFFRVGGASGTIAKTMSAYDMVISDAIYGQCERYVGRRRLQTMLDHEFGLLGERLREKRGATTKFLSSRTPWPRRATSIATTATAGWASASSRVPATCRPRSSSMSACWTTKISNSRRPSASWA